MPTSNHDYILETTHGDHQFSTDVHHDNHPDGIDGWLKYIWHHVEAGVNFLQSASTTTVNIIAIHHAYQGRKLKKVAETKNK